jgi:hypothetical protein
MSERCFGGVALASSQLGSRFSSFSFPSCRILPVMKCLLVMAGIPPALRIIGAQIVVRMLRPLAPTLFPGATFSPQENHNARHDFHWLRMRVLRRDRYRCRACDRKGDEITLCVYPIRSLRSHSETMVTLCAGCQRLLENLRLNARLNAVFVFRRGRNTRFYAQIYSDDPTHRLPMKGSSGSRGASNDSSVQPTVTR